MVGAKRRINTTVKLTYQSSIHVDALYCVSVAFESERTYPEVKYTIIEFTYVDMISSSITRQKLKYDLVGLFSLFINNIFENTQKSTSPFQL